jgi:hypothetical protein
MVRRLMSAQLPPIDLKSGGVIMLENFVVDWE